MDPGPKSKVLLYAQNEHRSQSVWEEGYSSNNLLNCRRVEACVKRGHEYDPRMDLYLQQSGFYGVARLLFIQLDWALITALVERWRPETHTFHMRHGEMTVTLEDVSVQLGLPIDGQAVIGSSSVEWAPLCHRLLGAVPDQSHISFGRLKMTWLAENFKRLPLNAPATRVMQFTRAYILQLIGGMVFADKTQNRVHLMYLPLLEDFQRAGGYSWGSACLAWLYRQLCRAAVRGANQIAGPLILLQIWAWDRFPHIAPRRSVIQFEEPMPLANRWAVNFDVKTVSTHVLPQYREAFDRQTSDQIVWRPYTEAILSQLPPICLSGRAIWNARVPLICFYVVEWHYPDRVLKQFGSRQIIPTASIATHHKELHQVDLRGKYTENWEVKHRFYVHCWNSRLQFLVPLEGHVEKNYLSWYEHCSRPTISHTGTMLRHLENKLEHIQFVAENEDPGDMNFIGTQVRSCRVLLAEHIAVRLHGRTDDPVAEPGFFPAADVVFEDSGQQGNTSVNEMSGQTEFPTDTSQVDHDVQRIVYRQERNPDVIPSSSSRPRRTKRTANRGRLLG